MCPSGVKTSERHALVLFQALPGVNVWSSLFQSPRHRIDAWDEMMMERDKRLTGHIRGQSVRLLSNFVNSVRCGY